jgi:hypothetical protein
MDIDLFVSYFEKKIELARMLGLREDATIGELVDAMNTEENRLSMITFV